MTQPKNKGGRPAFKPTDEQRRQVRAMVAYGVPLEDIANVIDIEHKVLSDEFRHEIRTAQAEANAKVAQALYKQAVEKDNVKAQIFWLENMGRQGKIKVPWIKHLKDADTGE